MRLPNWPRVSFHPPTRSKNFDATLKILQNLGNPHKKLPPTIHVAGTNGKGSTIAMLRSIFEEAGYSVHSYTSPHLVEFNERINLNGENISDYHLETILAETKQVCDQLGFEPTFFEGTTIAAFLAFSRQDADILLLETGLGGRLDFTNLIEEPTLTIITPISYDHMEYLGDRLEQIAAEKAGIIKADVPCIISMQHQEIYDLLLNKCERLASPSFCYEYDFITEKASDHFTFKSPNNQLKLPMPGLVGDHQIINAASAVAAILTLNSHFKISNEKIAQGLCKAQWPGRLQHIAKKYTDKLVGENIDIYIDGAHNESGAIALSQWARDNLSGPVYLIIGMTHNRDVQKFCQHFKSIVNYGIAVNVNSEPCSYSSAALAKKASITNIEFCNKDALEDALEHVRTHSGGAKATILITGSLFLISDFLKIT